MSLNLHKLFEAVGVAVVVMVLIALVGLLWGYIKWLLNQRRDKIYEEGVREGYERMKSRIMTDSYWLSEDKATMNLIQNMLTQDISQARDTWRRQRELDRSNKL